MEKEEGRQGNERWGRSLMLAGRGLFLGLALSSTRYRSCQRDYTIVWMSYDQVTSQHGMVEPWWSRHGRWENWIRRRIGCGIMWRTMMMMLMMMTWQGQWGCRHCPTFSFLASFYQASNLGSTVQVLVCHIPYGTAHRCCTVSHGCWTASFSPSTRNRRREDEIGPGIASRRTGARKHLEPSLQPFPARGGSRPEPSNLGLHHLQDQEQGLWRFILGSWWRPRRVLLLYPIPSPSETSREALPLHFYFIFPRQDCTPSTSTLPSGDGCSRRLGPMTRVPVRLRLVRHGMNTRGQPGRGRSGFPAWNLHHLPRS